MLKRLIILCCLLVSKLRANIIFGVDLGSDFFKMSVLKPGRPFTMVENLQSKTNTHTAVGFKDDERLFGPETLIRKSRFPKQSLDFIDRFLGEKFGDQSIAEYMSAHFVDYDMEEDENRKTFNFKLKYKAEDYFISPEEHFGMVFRYMKFLAEKFAEGKIYDVAVSVPNSWGYKKRHALSQAVRLAGLDLKGIYSQNVAAAVHWFSDKSFNTTEHYIFYNMGSSYTQATLVSLFSRYETDKKNKTTEFREINVLAEAWDDSLGGRDFDHKLVNMLMDMHDNSAQKKGKNPIKGNTKIAEKLVPEAIRAKEVLSANKQAGINVLTIEPGMNLIGMVQKSDFEENCKDLFDRVLTPIERLFQLSGLTRDNITAVELIGGGIRVPKIKEILDESFGSKVGVHMNGDNSMAFGTNYIYANSTKHFKVQKRVYANVGPAYEVRITIDPYTLKTNHTNICPDDFANDTLASDCTRKVNKNTTLFKLRHGSDVTRTVSFKHDSDLQIKVYEKKEGAEYIENYQEQHLMTFYVTNFDEVKETLKKEKVNFLPKTHLRFKSNEAGLITLSAEVSYEVDMYFTKVKGENNTEEFKYILDVVEALGEDEITQELEKYKSAGNNDTDKYQTKLKSIGSSKKSERKVSLNVERVFTFPRPLNKTELEESKKKLDAIEEYEKERIKNMEARNGLESDIYSKKEWLESHKAKTYAKSAELEALDETIKSVSEWYDDEGYNANTTTLLSKQGEISKLLKPIERRIKNHDKTSKAIEEMDKELERIKSESQKLIKSKDWLEKHYNEVFSFELTKIETWYTEKKAEHKEKPLNEDPILHHDTIHSKLKIAKREFSRLKDVPKPKVDTTKEDAAKKKKEMEELLEKIRDKGQGDNLDNLTDEDKAKLDEMMVS